MIAVVMGLHDFERLKAWAAKRNLGFVPVTTETFPCPHMHMTTWQNVPMALQDLNRTAEPVPPPPGA